MAVLTDIVAVRPNPLRIDVFRNNGSGFDGGIEWHSEPYDYSGYLFRFGDTRAQGQNDIIAIQPNPLRIVTWRNNGGNLEDGREWRAEPYDYFGYLFFAGDIDGDGKTEVIAVQQDPLRIVVWANNGHAFGEGREWHAEPYDYSGYSFFAGDIDADGKTDIIAIQENPLRIVTWQNNGKGFDSGRECLTEPFDYSGYSLSVGDIDGDGRTDIIAIRQKPLRIVTWLNNGTCFDGGREWHDASDDFSGYLVSTGDIDGDGKADLIAIQRNPLRMVTWRNNGGAFDGVSDWFPEDTPEVSGLFGHTVDGPITILTMPSAASQ